MENQSVVHRLRFKVRARRAMRRAMPFVASLFLATPLAGPVRSTQAKSQGTVWSVPPASVASSLFQQGARQLYQELGVAETGLRYEVFEKAYTGYLNLRAVGKLDASKQLLTVVDFELPSTQKRLWVLDLAQKQLQFNSLVAHGHNSGENMATDFSNENESNKSSLGFYVTDTEYYGKHGRSLKLDGVDLGYNDNARDRSVVMHGAEYVSEEFIKQHGRLGRSLGCPALPMDLYAPIIDTVGGGTCMFLNGNDPSYQSQYLDATQAAEEYVSASTGQTADQSV